ncbi:ribosome modulation factor [Caenispirillum bisanense]|uniref:ribosome modulation factor n=1 Tax=Caenispirillum bisanense TaxID=414052 RepID=UPI0031D66FB2
MVDLAQIEVVRECAEIMGAVLGAARNEGYEAYWAKLKPKAECPYPDSPHHMSLLRAAWIEGWQNGWELDAPADEVE